MGIQHRTGRLQHLAIRGAIVALVACGFAPAAAAENDSVPIVSVRSTDPSLAALIDRAAIKSPTFQRLLATLQRTNGMVQIEAGTCGHSVRACLRMWMEAAASYRFLRVTIDRRKGDSDVQVMASMGHELQHAVEALSEPGITDGRGLYNFFGRFAPTEGDRFETLAALRAGDNVRNELRRR